MGIIVLIIMGTMIFFELLDCIMWYILSSEYTESEEDNGRL